MKKTKPYGNKFEQLEQREAALGRGRARQAPKRSFIQPPPYQDIYCQPVLVEAGQLTMESVHRAMAIINRDKPAIIATTLFTPDSSPPTE